MACKHEWKVYATEVEAILMLQCEKCDRWMKTSRKEFGGAKKGSTEIPNDELLRRIQKAHKLLDEMKMKIEKKG